MTEEFIPLETKVDVFTLDESLLNKIIAESEDPISESQIHEDDSDPDQISRNEVTYGITYIRYGSIVNTLKSARSEFEVRDSKTGAYLRILRDFDKNPERQYP